METSILQWKEGASIRMQMIKDEPWFVAKDVADYFGDMNRERTMRALDDDEKGVTQMTTPGGNQTVAIVNESGLYSMIFQYQPQKARGVSTDYINERREKIRAFRKWVTGEVLPSLRKYGYYVDPEAQLTDEHTGGALDGLPGVVRAAGSGWAGRWACRERDAGFAGTGAEELSGVCESAVGGADDVRHRTTEWQRKTTRWKRSMNP